MTIEVQAFTDGACRGNPGPGGWGVVLRAVGPQGNVLREKTMKGAQAHTTNNRMELLAAIQALEALTRPSDVVLTTDSEYVKNGMTQWLANWKQRGWVTASKTPVKNADLWQRLDAAQRIHRVRWDWVRGHSGHADNETADALANQAIDELLEK